MRAQLAGETDFAGFRTEARVLLARGVPPEAVQWSTQRGNDDLFADDGGVLDAAPAQAAPLQVPPSFVDLCRTVVLHSDAQRFALLYRLLWRLAHEPALRGDPIDPDMLRAQQMAHAVRRDIHKMRAFLRFRQVPQPEAPGGVLHVAWFEPEHHIVEENAPWFARRFATMHWAILTPQRCAAWDGLQLHLQPGAGRDAAPPADAGEHLWLTYYRSIFNPARLKMDMMRKEMPRKYWHNLPEATLISELAAQAQERSGSMIAQPASEPRRRIRRLDARVEPLPPPAIDTLDALAFATQRCRDCPIGAQATQAVPGVGPQRPALMVVGEQPGEQEDLQGLPFVGPAGQLLDRALQQAGVAREALYLTNAVRHFKFELRGRRRIHKTPSQREAAACAHWLEAEIALVRPGALLALGATAARSLLQRPVVIAADRGQWHRRGDGLAVFVTWHPSALLRMDGAQRDAAHAVFVDDLRAAMQQAPRQAA